ncbi:MAG: hypothetical protein RRZ24_03530 [Clostridia bacterium]
MPSCADWYLDIIFREDASRTKCDHFPLNLNLLRKTALPLLQAADFDKMGIQKKMFRAALAISFLRMYSDRQKANAIVLRLHSGG